MSFSMAMEILVTVLGGLGIFLLGMKNMSEGMQAVAGARLRRMIAAVTDNRLLAVLVGTGVTCVVQSSSITTVMVVGLVNSGFMSLMQAIGVIFGANIGTTITGWILTLKIGKYGLPILGLAALVFLFSKRDRWRYTAMVFLGIGMVFFGLELMSNGFKPLRSAPSFVAWFHAFDAHTYFGVLKCALVGCLVTMLVQSSSATLGITMGLAKTGVIPFETAAALVLGENIGTTITAYLASLGANRTAKRAAYAHMAFNLLGVAWITALFPVYLRLVLRIVHTDPSLAVIEDGLDTFPHALPAVAMVHTIFNVANTLLFIPFMGILARFVTRLAPDHGVREKNSLTYLDVRMFATPTLGIEQSGLEVVFMADSVGKMLDRFRTVLVSAQRDPDNERKIFHREEILDNAQREITVFVSRLLAGSVPREVADEGRRQLRMADEYESLSDHVADLTKMRIRLLKANLELSPEGQQELLGIHDAVTTYARLVRDGLAKHSPGLLTRAHTESALIGRLVKDSRRLHLLRLSQELVAPEKSLVFTDMLSMYRRIRDALLNVAECLEDPPA